jgi:hypothetical protein
MQKFTINKRSWLRMLLGVYLFPLFLVCFSLSVPPADLPLCGLMFIVAALGLVLARRESRAWRVIWTSALILSVLCGALEVVAGKRIAHQRSKNASISTAYFSQGGKNGIPLSKPAFFRRYAARNLQPSNPRLTPWATLCRCSEAIAVPVNIDTV